MKIVCDPNIKLPIDPGSIFLDEKPDLSFSLADTDDGSLYISADEYDAFSLDSDGLTVFRKNDITVIPLINFLNLNIITEKGDDT